MSGRTERFARRHGVFGVVLLAAATIRVIAMLGYPGALFYPDSTAYLVTALGNRKDGWRIVPGGDRPVGYAVMLRVLEPLHSLETVIGIQHIMGLCIGVLGYAVLRRYRLPGWGATLAMVPVLLSGYAVQMEHFVLSDTLFALLVMMAVVLMMRRPDPPLLACALAGLLVAAAVLVRTEGTPLLIVFLACLLIRFAGWQTLAGFLIMCVAFAIPVAAYSAWFDSVHGTFQVTTNEGAFLYGTVSTFADCSQMQPPAAERPLCLTAPVSQRKDYPPYYIWSQTNPLRFLPGGEFGNLSDRLGTAFALRAIRAQPLDYLRVVGENFEQSFLLHGGGPFRPYTIAWYNGQGLRAFQFPAVRNWHFDVGVASAYDRAGPDSRVVRPFSSWVLAYQRFIVVPGPLLALIALTGLAGLIPAWRRRGGPALLPWLIGITLLVTPPAFDGFDARYIICAIPPLCMAAAIGVQQIAGWVRHTGGPDQRPSP
jgi:hypothetical protein